MKAAKSKKTLYGVKLVVAGTSELLTVSLKAVSEDSVRNYILENYGYCSYLVITEL